MTKEIWLNLSVQNIDKTKNFFEKLGFTLNAQAPNSETMVSFSFGSKGFIINFFREDVYNSFIAKGDETNGAASNKVLISLDAENEAEVDEVLQKAEDAGAKIYAKGGYAQGWMYGGGFIDLDGHQWNLLWMDMAKMPTN